MTTYTRLFIPLYDSQCLSRNCNACWRALAHAVRRCSHAPPRAPAFYLPAVPPPLKPLALRALFLNEQTTSSLAWSPVPFAASIPAATRTRTGALPRPALHTPFPFGRTEELYHHIPHTGDASCLPAPRYYLIPTITDTVRCSATILVDKHMRVAAFVTDYLFWHYTPRSPILHRAHLLRATMQKKGQAYFSYATFLSPNAPSIPQRTRALSALPHLCKTPSILPLPAPTSLYDACTRILVGHSVPLPVSCGATAAISHLPACSLPCTTPSLPTTFITCLAAPPLTTHAAPTACCHERILFAGVFSRTGLRNYRYTIFWSMCARGLLRGEPPQHTTPILVNNASATYLRAITAKLSGAYGRALAQDGFGGRPGSSYAAPYRLSPISLRTAHTISAATLSNQRYFSRTTFLTTSVPYNVYKTWHHASACRTAYAYAFLYRFLLLTTAALPARTCFCGCRRW